MTKEKLIEMGLTEEQATKVMEGLDGSYVPKVRFNEVNTELNTAKATIKERDGQLVTLQKSTGDVATLQQTITTLQTDNKTKDETHATEIKTLKLNNAVDKALTGAKAKSTTAAKALLASFLEKAELADDGTVKGLGDEIKKLTDNKETSFLFDVKATDDPGIAGASPAGTVTTTPDPKRQGYETRLAEARKTNDNLTAIKIKQEAAAEGVVLM